MSTSTERAARLWPPSLALLSVLIGCGVPATTPPTTIQPVQRRPLTPCPADVQPISTLDILQVTPEALTGSCRRLGGVISADRRWSAVYGQDGTLCIVTLEQGRLVHFMSRRGLVPTLSGFSPGDAALVAIEGSETQSRGYRGLERIDRVMVVDLFPFVTPRRTLDVGPIWFWYRGDVAVGQKRVDGRPALLVPIGRSLTDGIVRLLAIDLTTAEPIWQTPLGDRDVCRWPHIVTHRHRVLVGCGHQLWVGDVDSGDLDELTLEAPGEVEELALAADGRVGLVRLGSGLVAVDIDADESLWRARSVFQFVATADGQSVVLSRPTFGPDSDTTLTWHDVLSGAEQDPVRLDGTVDGLVSLDGGGVLAETTDGRRYRHDPSSRTTTTVDVQALSPIAALDFVGPGDELVVGTRDSRVALFDATEPIVRWAARVDGIGELALVRITAGGHVLVNRRQDFARLLATSNGEDRGKLFSYERLDEVMAPVLDSVAMESPPAVVLLYSHHLEGWDLPGTRRRFLVEVPHLRSGALFFEAKRRLLIVASETTVSLHDVGDGHQVAAWGRERCEGQLRRIFRDTSILFDGVRLLEICGGAVRALDVDTGAVTASWKLGAARLLTADGDRGFVVLEKVGGRVGIWSADAPGAWTPLSGQGRAKVTAAAVAADGRRLALGSEEGLIRLFDTANGALEVTLLVDGGDWVAWTPEGAFDGSERGLERWIYGVDCHLDILPWSQLPTLSEARAPTRVREALRRAEGAALER